MHTCTHTHTQHTHTLHLHSCTHAITLTYATLYTRIHNWRFRRIVTAHTQSRHIRPSSTSSTSPSASRLWPCTRHPTKTGCHEAERSTSYSPTKSTPKTTCTYWWVCVRERRNTEGVNKGGKEGERGKGRREREREAGKGMICSFFLPRCKSKYRRWSISTDTKERKETKDDRCRSRRTS